MRHKRYIGLPLMHPTAMSLSTTSKAGQIRCLFVIFDKVFVDRHCRWIGCRWVDSTLLACRCRVHVYDRWSRIIVERMIELSVCRCRLQYVCMSVDCRLSLSVVHYSFLGCWCRMSVVGDRWLLVSVFVHYCLLLHVVGVILCSPVYEHCKAGKITDQRLFEEDSIKQYLLPYNLNEESFHEIPFLLLHLVVLSQVFIAYMCWKYNMKVFNNMWTCTNVKSYLSKLFLIYIFYFSLILNFLIVLKENSPETSFSDVQQPKRIHLYVMWIWMQQNRKIDLVRKSAETFTISKTG